MSDECRITRFRVPGGRFVRCVGSFFDRRFPVRSAPSTPVGIAAGQRRRPAINRRLTSRFCCYGAFPKGDPTAGNTASLIHYMCREIWPPHCRCPTERAVCLQCWPRRCRLPLSARPIAPRGPGEGWSTVIPKPDSTGTSDLKTRAGRHDSATSAQRA